MNVRFDHANGSLVFTRNPELPHPQSLELLQADERSTGGEPLPCDYLAEEGIIERYWPGMPKIDFDGLLNFFSNVVDGISKIFIFTDADSSAKSVRFAFPRIEWQEVAFEMYAVKIQLREA
ncbi:MAG: hypothetical protein AB1553_02075 [Nitrospirota bacterium]